MRVSTGRSTGRTQGVEKEKIGAKPNARQGLTFIDARRERGMCAPGEVKFPSK